MFRRRAKLGLSRKIVAYYLFFSLIAVCWLAGGAVLTSRAVIESRSADSCLSRMGSAAAAVRIQRVRGDAGSCEKLLAGLRGEFGAAWCAVVDEEGNFAAHTSPKFVGRKADEPVGDRETWDSVTRVAYPGPRGREVHEYRSSLMTGGRRLGELRVAVEQPRLRELVRAAAPLAPLGMLAPLAVVGAGAWFLRGLTKPVTEVESLLQQAAREPFGSDFSVAPIRARDAVSLGWNRVVDRLHELERQAARGGVSSSLEQIAAARSDGRFEEVLQRLSDGIAVTDAAGRIEFANQAVAALLGHEADANALAGASLEERLRASSEDDACAELLAPAARQRTAVCELAQKTDDAERVLRVARLPLGGEPSRRVVWSIRDVTQQKLAEQTRDRFIDTATHELRTPLANIKAYAETLATTESLDIELQKEFCNIINSEVTRLARFIDDLLSISSMEVGALTIDRQKVETERLFAEVLAKVEPQMQKKSIEFQVLLAPKLPELYLDKDKMIAVAVNLLGNAAKYTPEGGRVLLKVKAEEGQLRIAVQDTGVGISAEELPKVFDKFFRSDDPRVQAEVGSGLGLSLAREVVRMHGGEITVESELNQGSTFTILLPLDERESMG
jgi:two-component system phosphate regulon sensor histidine kinase PhoR